MKCASSLCALAVVLGGAAFACGGNQPEPAAPVNPPASSGEPTPSSTPAPAASSAAAAPTPAPAAAPTWKEMNREQKIEHMKKVVMPKLGAVFKEFNAKEFAEFNCATCHGAGAKSGKFTMPNPDLPKLNVDGMFKKHMDKKPAVTKFMMEKVTPEMVATLGVAPYDPKTHQGFGCFGCHEAEKK